MPETTELLKQRFDYIFYTGSTAVGKIISKAAAVHLTPCTLELGGKSPVYIDDNCPNLERVIKRLVWGKMINLGQACIAPDYIMCSKKTEEKIVSGIRSRIRNWYGDKVEASPDLCRIVTERHFDRIMSLIKTTTGSIALGKKKQPIQFKLHRN